MILMPRPVALALTAATVLTAQNFPLAIVEKKAGHTAKAEAPVPTSMERLFRADWETGRRFLKPSTEEEAFSHGPFEREELAGAEVPGPSIPFTSSQPAVASLMRLGTHALHAFDMTRAERCFRTAAKEDPQCAAAWLTYRCSAALRPLQHLVGRSPTAFEACSAPR